MDAMDTVHGAAGSSGGPLYRPLVPCRPLGVSRLYSVHYFEYAGSYAFAGERHDFWELVYVDKGSLQVTAGERVCRIPQGQAIFHAPGEFHALSAAGVAPDLVVVGFACDGSAMEFFRGRTVSVRAEERALLARIVAESAAAFSTPLNDPATAELRRREEQAFGSEQLLCAALEELLIRLIRREAGPRSAAARRKDPPGTLEQVTAYLEQRVDRPLTLEQICRDNLVGRSQLQKLFHTHTGGGVMTYFGRLKIQAARRQIREGRLNFTQIAAGLGFQSVHYFSRRFRLETGMSPSEYARSVKMLSDYAGIEPDDYANNVHNRLFPFRADPPTIGDTPADFTAEAPAELDNL